MKLALRHPDWLAKLLSVKGRCRPDLGRYEEGAAEPGGMITTGEDSYLCRSADARCSKVKGAIFGPLQTLGSVASDIKLPK